MTIDIIMKILYNIFVIKREKERELKNENFLKNFQKTLDKIKNL